MSRLIDRLTQQNSSGIAFVNLWNNQMCPSVEGAFAGQQSEIDTINAIIDPNTLTPDKKPIWMFMYSFLTGEQSGLDSEATAFGITTEKTNYDNAVSTLTSYLATLTTPVAWNNTSGNTTIVDTTFRTNFTNVLTAKQALLNKMHDTSRSLANTAQSTATTAQTTANTAQTTANTANTNATNAQTTANTANTNASTAQSTANAVKLTDKISGSWTVPGTILTGTDAGTSASIIIASHDRHYGDNTSVTGVTGTTITGLSYSWDYYIYYDDTTTSTTTPSYVAVHAAAQAMPNKAAGRHYCGKITTPAAGAGNTSGGPGFSAAQVTNTELT